MNIAAIKKVKSMFTMKKYEDGSLTIDTIDNFLIGDSDPVHIPVSFHGIEVDTQDMYIKNMKKVVSGKWSEKTQNADFTHMNIEEASDGFNIINDIYNADVDIDTDLAAKISNHFDYKDPHILTIIKATVNYDDEEFNFATHNVLFITVNPMKIEKPDYVYNYETEELELDFTMKPAVKLNTPEWGVMYPSITDGVQDTNSILVYMKSLKVETIDELQSFLGAELYLPREQEIRFFNLVKAAAGNKIGTKVLEKIYLELYQLLAVEEETMEKVSIGKVEISNIIKRAGLNSELITDEKYEEIMGNRKELDVNMIVDKKPLNLVVDQEAKTEIKVNPLEVGSIEHEMIDGRKYLKIALNDDIDIGGMNIG